MVHTRVMLLFKSSAVFLCALRGAGALTCCPESIMHPLAALTFSTRVAKRAQYERFDLTPIETGFRVRNESHANPEDHEYLVQMDGPVPTACSCPADERFDGACKHRVAIAIRRPGRSPKQSSSGDATRIRGDGGRSANPDTTEVPPSDERRHHADESASDDCEDCLPDVPCWECYRQERRGFVGQ